MNFVWTGRGYLALLTLIGGFAGFSALILIAGGASMFEKAPWLLGVGWLIGAVANWVAGCRLNRRPLNPLNSGKRGRLLYRGARSRFLALPMEFWPLPAFVVGLILIGLGLIWF